MVNRRHERTSSNTNTYKVEFYIKIKCVYIPNRVESLRLSTPLKNVSRRRDPKFFKVFIR